MMTDTDRPIADADDIGSEPDDTGDHLGGQQPSTALPAAITTTDSRNLGLAAHLSALVAFAGVPSFIGPLVVWLLHRDRDNFVAEHAREALNFNLSLLIYGAAGVALSVLTIGLGLVVVVPLAVVAAVAWFAFTIMAALRAARGEIYHYPLTMQLIA